jgi:predicted DCC family thiol-disulfide oxidoreductase YuxK
MSAQRLPPIEKPRRAPDPSGPSRLADVLLGVDLRALAFFRVAVAATILVDLAVRAGDLTAHYTDFGVLPRSALLGRFAGPWVVSLHLINGTAPIQGILLACAALAAAALLVGWRTPRAALVSWGLLISLHARNPVVLQGSDLLLRMLLFWGLFLPLGARYSVDHALNVSREPPPARVAWPASAALLLQVAIMYVFSAAHKHGADWWNGTAIANALQIDHFAKPLGQWLAAFGPNLWPLTYLVLAVEWLAPILLFVPIGRRWFRREALIALAALQIGLWMCLELGLFPWVSLVALIPFLTTGWWDAWAARLRTPARRGLRIFYDRECGFCRKAVLLIREFLLLPETPIRHAQDDPGIDEAMRRQRSWVVVDADGRRHLRFDAMLAILRASPLAWWLRPILAWEPLAALGGATYRAVADHRPLFGRLFAPLRPRRLTVRTSRLAHGLALAAFGYVLWWNIATLPSTAPMPRAIRWIGQMLQISQRWDMFAPVPMKSDGWYVIPGMLADGRLVDLMRGGGPISWEKPALVSAMYPNQRWRKYLVNLHKKSYSAHRPLFARYICRNWNTGADPSRRLESLELIYMREDTPAPGESAQVRPVVLLQHACQQ